MKGNTSLNLDLEELTKINSEVADARNSMSAGFSKINGCFEELKANVTGTQVNGLMNTITDNLNTINSKMHGSFEQLVSFLDAQMRNYAVTTDDALKNLQKALSFIDQNL